MTWEDGFIFAQKVQLEPWRIDENRTNSIWFDDGSKSKVVAFVN